MNFPFDFKLLVAIEKSYSNVEIGIVWASTENHETSFAKLYQFKFNEQGKFGSKEIKEYLTQLVSYRKKICCFYKKHKGSI